MASTDTYNTLMSRFKKPNRQSMDRQQMQGQVYSTPGVTAPAKPALTAADVEKEKNGTNGEFVQLGNSKPAATPATPEKPATAATPQTPAEPKPALTPEDTKPAMPGLKQEKIKGLEGVDTSPKSLKEWFGWYDEQRRRMGLETEADREKRERKENAERMIAAIGDGISALAQIHYAGKGAVVNPGTGTTLSEGVSKRIERLRQQRDAQENKVLGLLRQRKQDELAEKRAKREAARAEQTAKHQAKQEDYWDGQIQRWKDDAEHQRRQDEERERADKEKERLAAEKEANRTKEAENKRKDNNANKAKDRQSRERIAAKAEAGRQSRYNQTRADKQAKDKQGGRKSPTGGNSNKTRKESPTARKK